MGQRERGTNLNLGGKDQNNGMLYYYTAGVLSQVLRETVLQCTTDVGKLHHKHVGHSILSCAT